MRGIPQIWILLTIVIVAYSCKKDDPKRFEFQKDTEAYFSYQKNSRWIYKPVNGGANDTVFGLEHASGMADRPEGVAAVSSSTLIGALEEKVIIRAEAIPNQSLDRIAMLTLVGNTFQPGPILLNLDGVMNPEDSSVATKLLTFDVGGNQYDNIWEISLKDHPLYKKLWFAKNTGIIKKVYLNNDTFDLIKFSQGN